MSWHTYQLCASLARVQREREWRAEWLRLLAWEFVWRSYQREGSLEHQDDVAVCGPTDGRD